VDVDGNLIKRKGYKMTCIVGLVENNKVWIGGDSAGVGGLDIETRVQPKVFVNDKFIMGYTTSFRMGQLLEHSLTPPKYYTEYNLMKYMVTDFIDAIRKCLKEGGFAKKENEVESGGCFLVGFKDKLFTIEGDYQVAEVTRAYASVGCGEDYAKGSMYESISLDRTPEEKIISALECAQEHSAGVREPFTILSI